MLHKIPVDELGPSGQAMADAVTSCVHCGFCLPACPTYQVMGEEMDSPRGRIFLMKEVLEGNLPLDEATPYIDRCLGCLSCEPACPSGVPYRDLITPFRSHAEGLRSRPLFDRLLRWVVLHTIPYPGRFRASARLGSLSSNLSFLLPKRMQLMTAMLPQKLPASRPLPEITHAVGPRRARVALLAGCAQQVLAPEINHAAIHVLANSGVEVLVPKSQGCCGALAAHTGAGQQAQDFARKNLEAFPRDVDCVLTTTAGCGSGMHEYPLWLKDDPREADARELASLVKDVSVFLSELGPLDLAPLERPTRVAYHDACHLSSGQGVSAQPRALLRQVGNLELVEVSGGQLCCGSAGTYNIEQPETANNLGRQKAEHLYGQSQGDFTGRRQLEPVPYLWCVLFRMSGNRSRWYGPAKVPAHGRTRFGPRDRQIGLAVDVHHVPALHLCLPDEYRHPAAGLQRPGAAPERREAQGHSGVLRHGP